MVWICLTCQKKNNNSSRKCVTPKCKTPKPEEVLKKQIEKQNKKFLRDYCPVCKTHRNFTRIKKKNKWFCSGCHKAFKFKGEPVPETVTIHIIKKETNTTNVIDK